MSALNSIILFFYPVITIHVKVFIQSYINPSRQLPGRFNKFIWYKYETKTANDIFCDFSIQKLVYD